MHKITYKNVQVCEISSGQSKISSGQSNLKQIFNSCFPTSISTSKIMGGNTPKLVLALRSNSPAFLTAAPALTTSSQGWFSRGAADGVVVARQHGDASGDGLVHGSHALLSLSRFPNLLLGFLTCPILFLGFLWAAGMGGTSR